MQYIVFTSSIWKYYRYATFGKNSRTFRKILALEMWSKKGKSGQGSWGLSPHTEWVMGSLKVMSLVAFLPILARACPSFRSQLGHIWSQSMPFLRYLEFGSLDFDETLSKCSWYERTDEFGDIFSPSYPGCPCHHLGPNQALFGPEICRF